jgi:hypothetical protein
MTDYNQLDKIVYQMMLEDIEANQGELSQALISRIPLTDSYLNSVNIAVGKQRGGKSFMFIKEIIKISLVSKDTHLLVYVNRTGQETDKTFEKTKHRIKIPIVYLSHDAAPDYLQDLLMWKQFYNDVIAGGLENRIVQSQRESLFEKLHISDFSRPFLHTLVLLDDVAQAKILKNEKTVMSELMTQCAHINCSFFLGIQFWKALSPSIKSQASIVYVIGGFSKQMFNHILSQTVKPEDDKALWNEYRQMGAHDKMIIDVRENEIRVDN